jgi:hypothetical protein
MVNLFSFDASFVAANILLYFLILSFCAVKNSFIAILEAIKRLIVIITTYRSQFLSGRFLIILFFKISGIHPNEFFLATNITAHNTVCGFIAVFRRKV